ncbi:MAG: DUF1963 domain-containing protein [Armatimonadetes bacterium]|nr:DUF1963 domain-containing protein [Armatimonadota bacterium]
MTREDIIQALDTAGLNPYRDALLTRLRPAIRVRVKPADENDIGIGASKFGGSPDLTPEVPWPELNGSPLHFLAQIRLEECHSLDADGLLPEAGLLSFFYDAENQPWGDLEQAGGWAVLYHPGPSGALVRRTPPGSLERFRPCQAVFDPTVTYPFEWVEEADQSAGEEEEYLSEVLYEIGDKGPDHQLLGHPSPVQGAVETECECRRLEAAGESGLPIAELIKKAEERAGDWLLLLQIDSDENPQWMWGDGGSLYYCILRQDMAAREFNKSWLVMQCS